MFRYGKFLRRTGRERKPFGVFLRADEIDPDIAVVKQQIGTYLAKKGKGKAALPFYLRAEELEPETAAYHFAVGQLLQEFRGGRFPVSGRAGSESVPGPTTPFREPVFHAYPKEAPLISKVTKRISRHATARESRPTLTCAADALPPNSENRPDSFPENPSMPSGRKPSVNRPLHFHTKNKLPWISKHSSALTP